MVGNTAYEGGGIFSMTPGSTSMETRSPTTSPTTSEEDWMQVGAAVVCGPMATTRSTTT